MKKLIIAAFMVIASLEISGQMSWIADADYIRDQPDQFFSTKAGHYMIYYSKGIFLVNSDGIEIVKMDTSGVFPNSGSHAINGLVEMPDTTIAGSTSSYGSDGGGTGWYFSSIIKFDQNGAGTLLGQDYQYGYGYIEALSDGSFVVSYNGGDILIKDMNGEVVEEINLPNYIHDLLATPQDSIIVATNQGLVVMDRYGNIANTYPDYVFKSVKLDGLNRMVGVADSTITLLSSDYQQMAQVVLTGDGVKDFTVVADTVAVLTTSNMVKLYSGDLSFIHEFPLGDNEIFHFIAMNKGWIALAGAEVYGDTNSNNYSTTSFIKEYSMEGATTDHAEDIGMTSINLGSNVVIEPHSTNPNFNWVYFPDAKITIHNYGPVAVNQFYLRNLATSPMFLGVSILPGEEVVVPWPSLRTLVAGDPAGMTLEVCAWASQPNLSFDADASNDDFCTDFLVNGKETIKPQNAIYIYPNPTTDYLNFQLRTARPVQEATFRILDVQGRVLREFQSNHLQDTFIVPVEGWAAGVYFLEASEKGVVLGVERFVVK
jgi:hypothetical protein